jgi:hypothetical protein
MNFEIKNNSYYLDSHKLLGEIKVPTVWFKRPHSFELERWQLILLFDEKYELYDYMFRSDTTIFTPDCHIDIFKSYLIAN